METGSQEVLAQLLFSCFVSGATSRLPHFAVVLPRAAEQVRSQESGR